MTRRELHTWIGRAALAAALLFVPAMAHAASCSSMSANTYTFSAPKAGMSGAFYLSAGPGGCTWITSRYGNVSATSAGYGSGWVYFSVGPNYSTGSRVERVYVSSTSGSNCGFGTRTCTPSGPTIVLTIYQQ